MLSVKIPLLICALDTALVHHLRITHVVAAILYFHSTQNMNAVRDNPMSFYVQFRDQT